MPGLECLIPQSGRTPNPQTGTVLPHCLSGSPVPRRVFRTALSKCVIIPPVLEIVPDDRMGEGGETWREEEAKTVAIERNSDVVLPAASLVVVPAVRFGALSSRWCMFHVGMF